VTETNDSGPLGQQRSIDGPSVNVAVLSLKTGDHTQDFILNEISTIGRSALNTVCVQHSIASRRHAEIRRLANCNYEISDLNSAYGTYVNRERIRRRELQPGDEIIVGATQLTFCHKEVTDLHARRQHNRFRCNLPARITVGGHHLDTRVLDISLSGASVLWEWPIRLGMPLTLIIVQPGRWWRLKLLARTFHGTEHGVGVMFAAMSNRQETALERLLLQVMLSEKG